MWCDLISGETEAMLNKSYVLQRNCKNFLEQDRLEQFVKIVTRNFPKFSAARFFTIDRSTILNVLNTVTTFFIIIIQFRISSTSAKC